MGDVYCSPKFKCGEDLDKALLAALTAEDNANRAAENANRAEAAIAAAETATSKPNLLDNWYFLAPINQREQTEYTDDGYTIDRWKRVNATVSVVDDGVLLDNTAGTGGSWFQQPIETDLIGKMVTISLLLANGNFYSASGVVAAGTRSPNISLDNAANGQFYVEVDSDTGVNKIAISTPKGTSKILVAVKLELGSVQTLARQDENGNWVLSDPPPDKGLELLKCQRYQVVYKPGFNLTVADAEATKGHASPNFFITTPVPLRAVPEITFSEVYVRNKTAATEQVVNSCVVIGVSGNRVGLAAQVDTETSSSRDFSLRVLNGGHLIFDANL